MEVQIAYKANHGCSYAEPTFFHAVNFTQNWRLASVNWDMNKVLAIRKKRMSVEWFSADLLCHQPLCSVYVKDVCMHAMNFDFRFISLYFCPAKNRWRIIKFLQTIKELLNHLFSSIEENKIKLNLRTSITQGFSQALTQKMLTEQLFWGTF